MTAKWWLITILIILALLFLVAWFGWSLHKPPPPVTPVDNSALYHKIDSLNTQYNNLQTKLSESQNRVAILQQQNYEQRKKIMAFSKLDVRLWVDSFSTATGYDLH